ncbi:O-antigen ligase family protein [Candidatus Peregrinibacteria bacterium]|nr:O-antigen ligase family protein [Candidatus Peregrinibacteria bacterium]
MQRFYPYFLFSALGTLFAISLFDRGGIHLLVYLLFGLSIFPIFVLWFFFGKRFSRHFFLYFSLFLFLFFVWLSAFLSPFQGEGIRELIAFSASSLLFFFMTQFSFSRKTIDSFLLFLIVVSSFALIYGYYVYIYEAFNRFASSFRDFQFDYVFYPNAFANFILFLLPISGYFLWNTQKYFYKILFFLHLVFSLSAFFLTYSRGVFLSLFVSFIIFLFILLFSGSLKKRVIWLKLFSFFVAFILSIFVVTQVNALRAKSFEVIPFYQKATLQASEKASSVNERMDFWKGSLNLIFQSPWFGTGPYSFQYVFPPHQNDLLAISDHPHNFLLKIAVENGILAIVFLFFFVIAFARAIFRGKDNFKGLETLFIALVVSLLSGFFHNLIDYNLNFISNLLLFVLFLSFIFIIFSQKKSYVFYSTPLKIALFVLVSFFTFFILHETYFGYFYKIGRNMYASRSYETALDYYHRAEPMFFRRRLFFDMSESYRKLYENTGQKLYLQKTELYLSQAVLDNPFNPFFINARAEILLELKRISHREAVSLFSDALRLDPKNNFSYYRNLLFSLQASGRSDDYFAWIPKVDALLYRYLDKVRYNEHLTVLTENPRFALELLDVLIAHENSAEKKQKYLALRYAIRIFYEKKLREMAKTYGIPFKELPGAMYFSS